MRNRPSRACRAFTLVEMLIVLGIVILLVSILLPVVMRARRASRATACASNLRQIGQMILMYADANQDLLPMGTSAYPKDTSNPLNPDAKWISEPTWTCYLIVNGVPTGNLGPLYAARMITPDNAKFLYCPNDNDEKLNWNLWKDKYPPRGTTEVSDDITIRISYFARPVTGLFRHTLLKSPQPRVLWPGPTLIRLDDLRNKAIYAERNSHGSERDPRLNILFYDGSVKFVMMKPAPEGSSGGSSSSGGSDFYTTPDHLPPLPETDTTSAPDSLRRITVFTWDYFDTQ